MFRVISALCPGLLFTSRQPSEFCHENGNKQLSLQRVWVPSETH